MNTSQSEYQLIPCDRLFSRIEENLSSYTTNQVMDTGKFLAEIKWCIAQLGLGVFEMKEALLKLKDHKVELPCDFYLLDSAWLCHPHDMTVDGFVEDAFQSKSVIYTTKSCEKIVQNDTCGVLDQSITGVVISSYPEDVIEKITVKEYIRGEERGVWDFHTPTLMKLNLKKGQTICSKESRHLFHNGQDEITILKQGNGYFLYCHNHHDPKIFIKYWRYPIDEETNLPLIPNDPIIEKAIENYLMYFFFKLLYLNGDDVNLENKLKLLQADNNTSWTTAQNYVLFPSFNRMIDITRRVRKKFSSYELMNRLHW